MTGCSGLNYIRSCRPCNKRKGTAYTTMKRATELCPLYCFPFFKLCNLLFFVVSCFLLIHFVNRCLCLGHFSI
uniref:Uncharacterized protein n=1 Tax=Utricularia reniformis TaxID=192314 RepID=A0A1Y0B1D2_9LAMI|nr:hypothetical protein AEK19_MT0958 [Utricularia reniformis]ART31184.1 hypothetical protein AEK19_MT0958 [Utricularia reniformis]